MEEKTVFEDDTMADAALRGLEGIQSDRDELQILDREISSKLNLRKKRKARSS